MTAEQIKVMRELLDGLQKIDRNLDMVLKVQAAWRSELNALSNALQNGFEERLQTPVKALDILSEHRRDHRPGKPSKIDSDPELRAFILDRIDMTTLEDLADQIAATFPPDRRVAKSALHRWWRQRQTTE